MYMGNYWSSFSENLFSECFRESSFSLYYFQWSVVSGSTESAPRLWFLQWNAPFFIVVLEPTMNFRKPSIETSFV